MKTSIILGLSALMLLGQSTMPGCPQASGPTSDDNVGGGDSTGGGQADDQGGGSESGDQSDFTPASGQGESPPNAPVAYGPWNTRLRVATSVDGLAWTRTGVTITDQGDVPSVVVADGKLWVFYVIWHDADETPELFNATVAAYSADLTNWTFKRLSFSGSFPSGYTTAPVDPTVVAVEGGYRMYFTLGPTGGSPQDLDKADTYSAFSTDLIHWTLEGGSRFSVTGQDVLDPSLVWVGDHYEYFAGTKHATSDDGLSFTYVGEFSAAGFETLIPSNGAVVGGAYKYYAFDDSATEIETRVYSMTYAAGTWTVDDGIRLAVDATTGQETGLVRDPAVCAHPAGESHGYVMVYVTGIP